MLPVLLSCADEVAYFCLLHERPARKSGVLMAVLQAWVAMALSACSHVCNSASLKNVSFLQLDSSVVFIIIVWKSKSLLQRSQKCTIYRYIYICVFIWCVCVQENIYYIHSHTVNMYVCQSGIWIQFYCLLLFTNIHIVTR